MTDKMEWAAVLRFEPEKVVQCPVLKNLDGILWWWILIRQPQLASWCQWSKFKGRDWEFLLGFMPQYADKCRWQKLTGENWCNLLIKQPQLAVNCRWWHKLSGKNWCKLLLRRPEFFDECDLKKLDYCDCKQLVELSSPLSEDAKEKVRQLPIQYAVGCFESYEIIHTKSQCYKCRFLSHCAGCYKCLYNPEKIPLDRWINHKKCKFHSFRKLASCRELHEFAVKYRELFQSADMEDHYAEFEAELLLLGCEIDYASLENADDLSEISDIKLLASAIISNQFLTEKHPDWLKKALTRLAELAADSHNSNIQETQYE